MYLGNAVASVLLQAIAKRRHYLLYFFMPSVIQSAYLFVKQIIFVSICVRNKTFCYKLARVDYVLCDWTAERLLTRLVNNAASSPGEACFPGCLITLGADFVKI